jgi:hypothetical protein
LTAACTGFAMHAQPPVCRAAAYLACIFPRLAAGTV